MEHFNVFVNDKVNGFVITLDKAVKIIVDARYAYTKEVGFEDSMTYEKIIKEVSDDLNYWLNGYEYSAPYVQAKTDPSQARILMTDKEDGIASIVEIESLTLSERGIETQVENIIRQEKKMNAEWSMNTIINRMETMFDKVDVTNLEDEFCTIEIYNL